jgi:hypothetical protein
MAVDDKGLEGDSIALENVAGTWVAIIVDLGQCYKPFTIVCIKLKCLSLTILSSLV